MQKIVFRFGTFLTLALSLGMACLILNNDGKAAEAPAPHRKVLLVTSLDGARIAKQLPWELGFMRSYFRNYDYALEKNFRAFFRGRGIDVDVDHYADQADLAAYLHSPEYDGIYLVSHEAAMNSSTPGMTGGGLFDYAGYEITPILSEIHPNIKVLALVGCISYPLTQKLDAQFKAAGSNPNLQLWGFKKEVDAKAGLKSVLNVSLPHLTQTSFKPAPCAVQHGIPISFKRTCGAVAGPAVRAEANQRVIAVFSHCEAGEIQIENGFIESTDTQALSAAQLKFQMTSGINAYVQLTGAELGTFEITRPGQESGESWILFTKPDGTPFGTTTHVYRHQGPLPEPWQAQDFSGFYGCTEPSTT